MEPVTYYINRLALDVYSGGYLVQVTVLESEPPNQHSLSDLPDWVFRSRLAIWFVKGEEPIYNRAQIGELIKRELMSEMPPVPKIKNGSFRSLYRSSAKAG